jgi:hypothetical protein
MKNKSHLTDKILNKVTERVWRVGSSLQGLSGLFTQGTRDMCLDDGEFYGLGNLLKGLSIELSIIKDILNCGVDSTADERNAVDEEEESVKVE